MIEVVGVRFQKASRIYYFDPGDFELALDDLVVVETSRGHELGRVVVAAHEIDESSVSEPLKPVIRQATTEDLEQDKHRGDKNQRALRKSKEFIEKLDLPMKPITAQYNLDGSHLTVYFSAEKRIDFRELVRELSRNLKTHVELRQVGARDEAKMFGGIGKCGQSLCCCTFLSEFAPVSIKMAKEQDITLSPSKTSGICGRLLCCLGYECEQYREMKRSLPNIGKEVSTPLGPAKVIAVNPLKDTVWVELENGATIEYPHEKISQKEVSPTN